MARFKSSFGEQFAVPRYHGGYATETNSPNPDLDRRYYVENAVYYYESGCIEVKGYFHNRPYERVYTSRETGAEVLMACEFDTPMFLPDGTKIPKSWVHDNPVLLYDEEYGLYLQTKGTIFYPHRDASPHSNKPILIEVPPSVKEQNLKMKECNDVWMQCTTAHRMGAWFPSKWGSAEGNMKEWVKKPKSFDETPIGVKQKLSIAPVLRTVVKENMTKIIEVPYLLNRRIENGNSTNQ